MVNRQEYSFKFGKYASRVRIAGDIPAIEELRASFDPSPGRVMLICDANTEYLAQRIAVRGNFPLTILEPGEAAKSWDSVADILRRAYEGGLGRDGLFIGVGGGVVCDLTAFAASVYMRGVSLCLVPTTFLSMVDAALGGKSGFDFFNVKNLIGSFYPAPLIHISLESLATLPEREWRSGMAELIKTAVLDEEGDLFSRIDALKKSVSFPIPEEELLPLISRGVEIKGRIVEEDPNETGERRALLNLGHTFGHALESAAGLGRLSHGEAVAWGMVRSCELGRALGITPPDRAQAISELIRSYGYETRAPHPMMENTERFIYALGGDKKKKEGKLVCIVPAASGAQRVSVDFTASSPDSIIPSIIHGAYLD